MTAKQCLRAIETYLRVRKGFPIKRMIAALEGLDLKIEKTDEVLYQILNEHFKKGLSVVVISRTPRKYYN